jgi:hypothetical protein
MDGRSVIYMRMGPLFFLSLYIYILEGVCITGLIDHQDPSCGVSE